MLLITYNFVDTFLKLLFFRKDYFYLDCWQNNEGGEWKEGCCTTICEDPIFPQNENLKQKIENWRRKQKFQTDGPIQILVVLLKYMYQFEIAYPFFHSIFVPPKIYLHAIHICRSIHDLNYMDYTKINEKNFLVVNILMQAKIPDTYIYIHMHIIRLNSISKVLIELLNKFLMGQKANHD